MNIKFYLNGQLVTAAVDPDTPLLETLRSLGCFSVKRGCDTGMCGLCTVWLDGKPLLSCVVPAVRVNGHNITTIEGVKEKAAAFGSFLAKEGADQCGYCAPGFIMTVLAMENELQSPTRDEIIHYLNGNLCRCTGYIGQLRAIEKYLGLSGAHFYQGEG